MTNEELAILIQQGNNDLMGELWEQNTGIFHLKAYGLYTRYAERCKMAGVELDDIIQCCYFALCDAVVAFKADGEYKLMSYIKYPLLNHLRAVLGIRTSKRDPLDQCSSLNETLADEGDAERLDLLVDPQSAEPFNAVIDDDFQLELRNALEKSISKLPANRADVIRRRYFEEKTHGEIASEMKVSSTRIQQLEREALKRLKREEELQSFRDEILANLAYKRTGMSAFKERGISSVEYAVLTCEEIFRQRGLL